MRVLGASRALRMELAAARTRTAPLSTVAATANEHDADEAAMDEDETEFTIPGRASLWQLKAHTNNTNHENYPGDVSVKSRLM